MRAFFRFFKGLHIWLAVNASLLALFFLLRGSRAAMNFWSGRVAMPFERAVGSLCAYLPVSVAELIYAAAVAAFLVFLVRSVVCYRRAPYKRDVVYGRILGLTNVALSVYALFCLLWGVNYYADDFCDKSGIRAQPIAYEDLLGVTKYFAEQTAACADSVPRHPDGTFAVPASEILDYAPLLYAETMNEEFPFLSAGTDYRPKGIFCSRLMSAMNFTGFYFPFTGECNVNTDFPADTLPATAAHELAHRAGIASEQQCNFICVLASTRSENAAYRYSGYLLGYIHLSNALYSVDRDAWREIRAALPSGVDADLRSANAYWAQFEGPTADVSNRAYDRMLKSYGQTLGMKSYGAVVDLLVAYYKGQ